jgi:hypothetical protein
MTNLPYLRLILNRCLGLFINRLTNVQSLIKNGNKTLAYLKKNNNLKF